VDPVVHPPQHDAGDVEDLISHAGLEIRDRRLYAYPGKPTTGTL